MRMFQEGKKLVVGMVHLHPLPGSPRFDGNLDEVAEAALEDALALADEGVDALLVENYGDVPYLTRKLPLLTVVAMAHIVDLIKSKIVIPLGINVQFDAYEAELVIATVCKGNFVRIEGFVDTLITDTGLVTPCAAECLRLRRQGGGEKVAIWADVQVKETQPIGNRNIVAAAVAAAKNLADAIIVTGSATGSAPAAKTLKEVKAAVDRPVLVGSGLTPENAPELLAIADGAIVGTALKTGGRIDRRKVRRLMEVIRKL
ncbi:MAG: BtpA/SgcQ family protein [Candidatus Hadarchaeum sp.]|uniref:BtpA/SgcQ family protein n=1 Tax=Candidatus Hadarchaeum sp. TaxID=2883567 RepID=UPI003D11D5D1